MKGKRIWIIRVAETVPTDGKGVRLMRAGLLAKMLSHRGHMVTWWNSTFMHQNKTQRYTRNTTISDDDNLEIIFLYGPSYKKSVSPTRIWNQCVTAHAFSKLARKAEPPDIIFCSLPTLELAEAAVDYGKEHNVPVIIDVRDLWPDAFMKYAPSLLKPLWRLLLTPLFLKVQRICAGATSIVGVTDEFVDWGLNYSGRQRSLLDKCFPFGYPSVPPDIAALDAAEKKWDTFGVLQEPQESRSFVACFFGFFGWHFEIDLIIEAARRLNTGDRKFTFVLCGTGDKMEQYQELAKDCKNIILPGWVGAADIWALMRRSTVGLAPYKASPTLSRNMPNKPIEYFSAGLPIVSSLRGVLSETLDKYECGITYNPGDIEDLIKILIDLYDNPEKVQDMSRNAKLLFMIKYDAEKVYGEMSDFIEHVCSHRI